MPLIHFLGEKANQKKVGKKEKVPMKMK